MGYLTLLGTCISLYTLLNFLVLPTLKRRWIATRSLTKISKAGLMAGLTTLRNVTLIASIMYSAFALLVLLLGLINGDAQFLAWLIDSAAALHQRLSVVKNLLESWLFVVPTALLIYLAWWRMRQDLRNRFADRVLDEMDRLNRERAADPAAWERSTTLEQFEAIDREISELAARMSAATSKGDRDARARSARDLALLRAKKRAVDYEARVNLDPIYSALEDRPQTARGRLSSLFLSRGFLADTKGVTKLLSRATLAVLTVALIGLGTQAGLADAIRDRITSLDDLRVENSKQHAPKTFASDSEQDPPLDADDTEAVRHLTQQFARALTRNHHWGGIRPAFVLSRDTELQLARRAILNHTSLPTPEGTAAKRAVRTAVELTVAERQIVDDLSGPAARSESMLGAEMADRRGRGIVKWFGSHWDETRKTVLEHAALYRQPVGPDDLQSALLDRVLTAIVDESVPEAGGEIGKQARSTLTSASKAAFNEGVEVGLRAMLADLDAGVSFDQAVDRVRTRPIAVAIRHVDGVALLVRNHWNDGELASKIAPDQTVWDAPPTGSNSPAKGTSVDLDNLARTVTQNGEFSLSENALEALAEYEDHFPRTIGSQRTTPLGRIVERLPSADRERYHRTALTKVARAHSFSMLRGFSRVGGVLIGIDSDNPGDVLDLTDLAWSVDNGRLTLSLVTSGGVRIKSGPYDGALIHQALAYAADGRPVAVTMTTARPLSQLKIHLHPALLDTPLGCHMIALDKLVDRYALEKLPRRGELTEQYRDQERIYRLAWANRAISLTTELANRHLSTNEARFVNDIRQAATSITEESKRDNSMARALASVATERSNSVFKRKPEFFDPALVDSIRICASDRDPDAFGQCVRARFGNDSDSADGRWLAGPASFIPWSGVRERSFHADRGLNFVRDEPESKPSLHPFRFMVQLAFTSAPVNTSKPTEYVDEDPLEFDEIEESIQKLVQAGVDEHGQTGMLADLRNFTLLQRLFRVLLRGQGGPRFPVRKLADLEAATAGSVPYVHTRRWNDNRSARFEASLIAQLASPSSPAEAPWVKSARSTAAQCVLLLAAGAGPVSEDQWRQACSFSDMVIERSASECQSTKGESSCMWSRLAQNAPAMRMIHSAESTFGVIADEALEARSSCTKAPSPPTRAAR